MKLLKRCNICDSNSLELVLDLPNYPLNTVYLEDLNLSDKYQPRNMQLYCCNSCHHFQALSEIPAKELYNADYNYYNQNSGVKDRISFFLNNLDSLKDIRFNRIIDIGCYDLTLLKEVKKFLSADYFIGIDPSIPNESIDNIEGIIYFRDYIDNVNLPYPNSDLPDLIISDQTFEHISEINKSLRNFIKQLNLSIYFAVCVPSLEGLIEKLNFHNIIHEHVNYFSIHTLTKLFENNKLFLNKYKIEYTTTCSFLFAIYSSKTESNINLLYGNIYTIGYFFRYYEYFKNAIANCKRILSEVKYQDIYGFGASDITANLAYFMDSDFSFLVNILDDTDYKHNTYYPFLKPKIISPIDKDKLKDTICLITAPQASRYLYSRLMEFKFKKIVNPVGVVS